MEAAITVENLTKRFEALTAVDGISFTVEKGELFALLGPNGAGKTTIINMLITLLPPTSGRARVAGFDVTREKDAVRRHIGIVFQEPALDKDLTGRENLDFHGMMYGLSRAEREQRIAEVLELVELAERADVLVQNYSGGMKRRLEIARGFIHRPSVLFLDEPTLGLDAQTRRRIWEYIRRMNREEGITIILTTHYMEEADYLSGRVAIIDRGKIVAMGTPSGLKDVLGGDVITLEVDGAVAGFAALLGEIPWVRGAKEHNGEITVTVEAGERKVPELVSLAQSHGVHVASVLLRKPSLEDVFIHFTGRSIREREVSASESRKELITRRMLR
ncbi:MAG: ATP-binding cassette domain-containing protein [Methanomicrobiales archaeon]|nr:ATP-binding cassette domain-containing protein [Methanomicrobiales archaeon]MDD1668606.1 ATP-binding cassette domain-containing protein [Methanomicrobiales archaeon]